MVEATTQRSTKTDTKSWCLFGRLAEETDPGFFPLDHNPFSVGRKSGLSLTLPRRTVSGNHCEFVFDDGRLVIRDLGSTNGTFVNGKQLFGETEILLEDVVQFADAPFRVVAGNQDALSHTQSTESYDQALAIMQFDGLLLGKSLTTFFQPIVEMESQNVIAYEALARSRLMGLETPDFMFSTSAKLGLTAELSVVMRRVAVDSSGTFDNTPHLFLNTHPCELSSSFFDSCSDLRKMAPHQKITIEIHEGAVTSIKEMVDLSQGLAELDMTLAFDDFGAGQARIAELAEVRPSYIKFDRSMIRELDDVGSTRRRVVQSLVALIHDLGITPLAEGVETEGEHLVCRDVGFVLGQGYYYGRPMPAAHFHEH